MIEVQSYLEEIQQAAYENRKMLAVLIDPDKFDDTKASQFIQKLPENATHIFVGGSTVEKGRTCEVVSIVKNYCGLPIILFPGDHSQISSHADALLFLSLISGRNPEFLIEQQVRSVEKIRNTNLEIIPTGYILIDGGKETSVQKVSNTIPLAQNNIQQIVNTALAGQYSGKKLIYLEAGSGAKFSISSEIIQAVKTALDIPVIVGGGVRSIQQLQLAYDAGADLVVIGTAFENDDFHS
ncbi:geranylgeranylglyceryl/heptaprenylglyceryl phosphate synthase [Christiangramia forsetii]|uniref:Geranylgeranylglyceryl phosphate synthase n=2 Tax=Christiangramia forsetii TaxID=411153 RepID=A0M5W4_CHRFK|nr:geranylgeranylglyceryl/heptaprenylglyceryl phosphate synthase [Christiangramia forsetii]GGG32043.1 geranylgeranylglyceryl phosphate synthase [Christiangramia forsetii]CAL68009.1 protein belonging to PcrB family [Christiangramia forsetii KT0803]